MARAEAPAGISIAISSPTSTPVSLSSGDAWMARRSARSRPTLKTTTTSTTTTTSLTIRHAQWDGGGGS